MGFEKHKRPLLDTAGYRTNSSQLKTIPSNVSKVQNISLSGASGVYATTTITPYGVTFITSTGTGAGWTLTLQDPGIAGVGKQIVLLESGASTVDIFVRTASSSNVFFGTTRGSFHLSTAAGSTMPVTFELISFTSKRWHYKGSLTPTSTAVGFVASTASTK